MGTRVAAEVVRRRFTVTGVVQGVGFRPFVHRVAAELGLSGFVGNASGEVFVEVQGEADAVAAFADRLVAQAPPLARIAGVVSSSQPLGAEAGFAIVPSRDGSRVDTAVTPIPPDVAVCVDCLRELFDPADRRYRHPFVTCTNCGPRFTIITGLPYDRPATTMAGFPMCDNCAREYSDPADRRFHAQPVCCPDCGPTLTFRGVGGGAAAGLQQCHPPATGLAECHPAAVAGDPVAAVRAALAAGLVVAVKGL